MDVKEKPTYEQIQTILKEWWDQGPSEPTNGQLVEAGYTDKDLLEHLIAFTIGKLNE